MSEQNMSYTVLSVVYIIEISFLYCYLTESLADANPWLSNLYWIITGLLGAIIGIWLMLKYDLRGVGSILAGVVSLIGFALLIMWLLALLVAI